jgi:DNA-binding beta-propeller fold protein YncE
MLALLVVLAGTSCGGGSSSIAPIGAPTTTNVALWVANGTNVLEILPTQSGVSDPAPHITLGRFGGAQGVQFDANGDLWVIDGGNGSNIGPALDEFTPAQLAAHETTPTPTASKTITSKGFLFPQQGVFDKNGDFWVADNRAGEIVEFTPAQLGAGGSITPNLTLISKSFNGPLGIAFSPINGELWVANNGVNGSAGTSIDGFAAASLVGLSRTQTVAPSDIINNDDGGDSIQAPWALVFDAAGNLWSSNSVQPNTIVEFASSQLGSGRGTRTLVPNITISPVLYGGTMTLNAPNGLAFDNLGGLWAVSSADSPYPISLFAAWQLAATGSTIPSILLFGNTTMLTVPAGDVFGPLVQ